MREHLPTFSDLLDLINKSLIITILVIFLGSFEKNDISYFINFFVLFSIIFFSFILAYIKQSIILKSRGDK